MCSVGLVGLALLCLAAPKTQAVDRPAPWSKAMDAEIAKIKKGFDGTLAAYVSDPYRGYSWGYREEVPMYLASGVKTAFMLEVFRQREAGKLSFKERLHYTEADIRDGAPRTNKHKIGYRPSIATLLDWMMRSSDNAASDMLVKRVGLKNINDNLPKHGLHGVTPLVRLIDVRRGVYRQLDVSADDLTPWQVRKIRWTKIWKPQIKRLTSMLGLPPGSITKEDMFRAYDRFYATGVNRAPMKTMGKMFELMLAGKMISPRASRDMLKLMSAARTSTHRILGKLPRHTKVAHKTGSQFRKLCDLGVVYLEEERPFVVTVCTASPDVHAAEEAVARIARKAYDLIAAERKRAGRS